MAQISTLVLNTQNFEPLTPQVGQTPAVWYEKGAGQLNGYGKAELAVTFTSNETSKVRMSIYLPVLDAEGNVSHHSSAVLTVNKSNKSTSTEKLALAAILSDAVSSLVFQDAVKTEESVY